MHTNTRALITFALAACLAQPAFSQTQRTPDNVTPSLMLQRGELLGSELHPWQNSHSGSESLLRTVIGVVLRSEEHTSELQSLMRSSYTVLCAKKKKKEQHTIIIEHCKTQTYE